MDVDVNLRVPSNAENFLTSRRPVSFSGRTLYMDVKGKVCQTQLFISNL